ncbi:MAG: hypothetical protein HFH30_14875 [Eubacterium sp.]|nr:hypothetical protein [Eubacterium sp.]
MKKKTKILALSLALTALITQPIMAAAGNHKIQALKLNPFDNKKNDAMVVANGIKNNASGYTYSITNKTTGVTSNDFYTNSSYIKYWAGEGTYQGALWGKTSGNARIDISSQKPVWAGGNLEFVFLAVCNQLNGSQGIKPRQIYAKAMRGDKGVRVISGYHDNAPSQADAVIAEKFIEYAKTGESVKSSWILANEYYKNDDNVGGYNARNYCVLTHSGNVQYSRFEGFPGGTYTRPGSSSTTILRFSSANPGGATELSSSELAEIEVPNYALKGTKRDINVSSTNVIEGGENSKISAVIDEIGDTPISTSGELLVETGLNWLENNTTGIERSTIEKQNAEITPIVMSEIDEYGNESQEQVVAYAVNYPNKFDGISIEGEGFDVIVDSEGMIAANIKWSDFNKVSNPERSSPVTYKQALQILGFENQMKRSDVNAMDATISFMYDENDDIYYPTWIFRDEDSSYFINCLTGDVN